MPEVLLTQILPTPTEAKQAEETSRVLSSRLRSKTPLRLRVVGAPEDETVVIPASAAKMLVGILDEMGRGKAMDTFKEIQQANGDTFICAGYLLGHLHGLEMHEAQQAPDARELLLANPPLADLIAKLGRVLHELWLSEFAWRSLEVFAPIYDLLCEMMALHGMAFARHGDEWRIIMSEERAKPPALKDFLISKAKESGSVSSEPRSDGLD